MEVKQGYLYCNRKLNIGSTFPLEVLPIDRIKVIKPCHIVKKCIRIDFGEKKIFLAIITILNIWRLDIVAVSININTVAIIRYK